MKRFFAVLAICASLISAIGFVLPVLEEFRQGEARAAVITAFSNTKAFDCAYRHLVVQKKYIRRCVFLRYQFFTFSLISAALALVVLPLQLLFSFIFSLYLPIYARPRSPPIALS